MRLRRVEVQRFRGIRELSWDVGGDFVCLLGPCDSTKTTILDAIELALLPRWSAPFEDCDFYGGVTGEPIVITVTVGDLPEELKRDSKYGLLARGWSHDGELHDEPEEDDELVLSIRLKVEADLEPSWAVVNEREPEGKPIGYKDRERLGCVRLGDFLDRHFAWGRGSILSRLTADAEGLNPILAEAARAARGAVAAAGGTTLDGLKAAAEKATRAGKSVGVSPSAGYKPHLDPHSVSVAAGGLSLHDGEIPVRRAGLGTRRLLAIGMQREAGKHHGVSLIDEIEHGLEPHRLRYLLRVLRGSDEATESSHVIMTTHSPVVLGELAASELYVVRSNDGETTILPVPEDLQRIVRKTSEAFLARKVLVCEGKTELGFCRGLDTWWTEEDGRSFGLIGLALADGGGSETGTVAEAFARLGYDVAVIADSDEKLNPGPGDLTKMGVEMFLWDGNVCIEERLALDLPWEGVVELVQLAIEGGRVSRQSLVYRVRSELGDTTLSDDPSKWPEGVELRRAIGTAARSHTEKKKGKKGWFKDVALGERLADIVKDHWDGLLGKDSRKNIEALRTWTHGN